MCTSENKNETGTGVIDPNFGEMERARGHSREATLPVDEIAKKQKHEEIKKMAWENWVHNHKDLTKEVIELFLQCPKKAPSVFNLSWIEAEHFYNFAKEKEREEANDE